MNRIYLVGVICATLAAPAWGREYWVYFGTYTGAKSKGIYVSKFDDQTGKLSDPALAVVAKSPSFLALHPKGKVLYAVGESASVGELKQGTVTAFTINEQNGLLAELNTQPSGGGGPCHLAVDAKGRHVFTANYGTGSVAALNLRQDGGLEAPGVSFQHKGSSVNPQRQSGPHAHCVTFAPDQRYLLACDLGLDKVMVYRTDEPGAPLVPAEPPFAAAAPGVGPRHLAFSRNAEFVYVLNEMGSSVTVFRFDDKRGTLKETQTTSTLPDKFSGESSGAEIELHPSGKFLYASNRGADSIAVFAVQSRNGELTWRANVPTLGRTPRHFALDPSGRWLLAENQGSDSVVVFRVDGKTGDLEPTGGKLELGAPVCAVFRSAGK